MDKTKTIWIINQYAGSILHGMEYRHYYLAKEFIKNGFKVIIISGSYSHLYTTQPTTNDKFTFEEIENITYCWVKVPRYKKSVSAQRFFNMIAFAWNIRKITKTKISKPDIIIVSSPSLFPILSAKKWAVKFNSKLLFEVRDLWPQTLQEIGNLNRFHPLILFMKYFEKYAYHNSNHIVSLLPNAKEYYIKNGMKQEKFVYIPNGIQIDNSEEKLPENIIKKIPNNKFIVGYTGTIGVANALSYFIEASKLLEYNKDIHFLLIGEGGEKNNLINRTKELKNITFIDSIPKKYIIQILSYFQICYIGLKDEPLFKYGVSPNKLFDYMLSAKPIIYAINSSNKPIDEANCGITIPSENPQEIANAILKMYKLDIKDRTELGQNGKDYVLKYHSYSELAKKYIELF